jgi:hypothetical protein
MNLSNPVPNEIVQQLREEMTAGYDKLIVVAKQSAFQDMLDELYDLPPKERPRFVKEVILNPDERSRRGINIPGDVLVLRSAFGDRRPTLFCIKKYLSPNLHQYWENVNLTFDNPVKRGSIPKDERAWKKPLTPDVQAILIATGLEDH